MTATTANPNWFLADGPTDLIPATDDAHGRGARMVELVGRFPITQGRMAGRPFSEAILPWQEKLTLKIHGDTAPDGTRVSQEVGLKCGKGSGKTVFLAATALASVVDWEMRGLNVGNQVVLIAANVASADLAFRHIREAISFDPWLRPRFHSNLSKREVTYKPTGVTVRVIAPDLENAVGLRPALILADELHQAAIVSKDFSAVIDQLKRGSMNTEEPLFIGCTTAAVARPEGYYREWLTRMRAVRDGAQVNPAVLPVLFEFPDSKLRPDLDITMRDEWWRAMPSLRTPTNPHGTMDMAALDKELEDAAADADLNGPGATELLLSQRFGLEAAERGGNSGQTQLARYWAANAVPLPQPDSGAALVVGMDPSAGLSDPFATVTLWADGPNVYARSRQFLTAQAYEESSRGAKKVYDAAMAQGELTLHADALEIEAAVVAHARTHAAHAWGVSFCGDAAGLAGFRERFVSEVGEYTAVEQNWKLLQSLEYAGGLAHGGRLKHGGQPLLTANLENLMLENGRLRKFDAKTNGVGHAKIDGAMALLSAMLHLTTKPRFDVAALVG